MARTSPKIRRRTDKRGINMSISFELIKDKVEFFEAADLSTLEKNISEQIELNQSIMLRVHHVQHQCDGRRTRAPPIYGGCPFQSESMNAETKKSAGVHMTLADFSLVFIVFNQFLNLSRLPAFAIDPLQIDPVSLGIILRGYRTDGFLRTSISFDIPYRHIVFRYSGSIGRAFTFSFQSGVPRS